MTQRRNRQRRSTLTANVNGMIIRGTSPKQVIDRLEQLAEEAETVIERELFNQHAEHYRKMVN